MVGATGCSAFLHNARKPDAACWPRSRQHREHRIARQHYGAGRGRRHSMAMGAVAQMTRELSTSGLVAACV